MTGKASATGHNPVHSVDYCRAIQNDSLAGLNWQGLQVALDPVAASSVATCWLQRTSKQLSRKAMRAQALALAAVQCGAAELPSSFHPVVVIWAAVVCVPVRISCLSCWSATQDMHRTGAAACNLSLLPPSTSLPCAASGTEASSRMHNSGSSQVQLFLCACM